MNDANGIARCNCVNSTAVAGVLHLQLNEHACLPEKNSGKGEA